MPNLLLKRNTNTGVVPTAGALSVGELAINAADSLLYTKDSGGTVRKIGGLTAVFTGDAQTLTNKVLTSPALGTSLVLNQTTANYTITWANPAAARSIALNDPGNSGSQFVLAVVSSPSSGDVIKYNGTAWINAADATAVPGGSTTQVQYNSSGAFAGSANLTYNAATLKLRANSANIQEWQNSGGTVLAAVDSTGELGLGTSTPTEQLDVVGSVLASTSSTYQSNTYKLTNAGSDFGGLSKPTLAVSGNVGSYAQFLIKNGDGTTGNWGTFAFAARNSSGNYILGSVIYNIPTSGTAGSEVQDLAFWTQSGGTASNEKMRITGAGRVGIGIATPGAQLQVNAGAAATIGQIVKGFTSQSANLTEWQNSAGTVLSSVNSAGGLALGPPPTTGTLLTVTSANLAAYNASYVSTTFKAGPAGDSSQQINFNAGDTNGGTTFNVLNATTGAGRLAFSHGYANATTVFSSSGVRIGTALSLINSTAQLDVFCGSPSRVGQIVQAYGATATVTTMSRASNVVTLTTSASHGFSVGYAVSMVGVDSSVNGGYTIASVPTATTFTFANSGADLGNTAVGGTATSQTQSSNILSIRDAIGQEYVSVGPAFDTLVGSPLTVRGNIATANQSLIKLRQSLFYWDILNDGSLKFVAVSNSNTVPLQITGAGTTTITPGSAPTKGLIVKGFASQSANLTEWQDSAGTVLSHVKAAGDLSISRGSTASLLLVANTNSPEIDFFIGGGRKMVFGYDNGAARGIIYNDTLGQGLYLFNSGGLALGDANTVFANNQFQLNAASTTNTLLVKTTIASAVPLAVRGFTSQTANLQEWQNSAGTVLANVTSGGVFTGSGAGLTGIVAGSTGQFQYNNAGAFGGTARLTYAASGTILAATPSANSDRLLSLTQLSRTINISTIAADGTQNVTVVTSTAHGLQPGQMFSIASSAISLLNGSVFLVVTVANSTTFTFGAPWTVSNISTTSDTGVITATDSTTAPLRISSGVSGGYVQIWGDGASGMAANAGTWYWTSPLSSPSGGRYPIEVFSSPVHGYPNRPVTQPWMSFNSGISDSINCPARIAFRRGGVDQCAMDLGMNYGSGLSVFNLWVGDGYTSSSNMTRAISVTSSGSVTLANNITFGSARPWLQVGGSNAVDTNAIVMFAGTGAKALVLQSNQYHATNTFELQTINSNTPLACITYQNQWVIGGGAGSMDGSLTVLPLSAAAKGLTVRGFTSQSANIQEWQNSTGTILNTVSESGYFTTRLNAAPADAELSNGEAAYWFDSTNGAAKFMIKAKQANGTVVTGQISLT